MNMKKAKIYGERLNVWTALNEAGKEIITQVEYAYREYNENGELCGVGSEDIQPVYEYEVPVNSSPWRYRFLGLDRKAKWVHGWDGKSYHKSGNRKFKEFPSVYFSGDASVVRTVLANQYKMAEIQLR